MVTDIGSLHGTFHNGDKLVKGCPRRLASGDILKFGVEIVRGDVVYPQCSVEVQIEQRSTYAVHCMPAVLCLSIVANQVFLSTVKLPTYLGCRRTLMWKKKTVT